MVATCDLRSLAGAAALLPRLRHLGVDVQVVARTTRPTGIGPETVANSIGLPLAGVFPTRRSLARAVDEGFGPPRRGRVMVGAGDILDQVLGAAA